MTRQEIVDTIKYCLAYGSMGGHDCQLGNITDSTNRDHCPNGKCETGCVVTTLREAATLLDDRPIEPILDTVYDALFWKCGKCGSDLMSDYTYCPTCGRRIGWNE